MIYRSNYYQTILENADPWYQFTFEVTLEDIKKFVIKRHRRKPTQVCIHELGVSGKRFDFVSLDPYRHRIRILEYKVSKSDFLKDVKWRGYLPFCNTFAFVTPFNLVQLSEVPRGVGLLQVFKWFRRGGNRGYLGAIWVRKPRGKPLTEARYREVADMMLARVVQGRKEDFF